MVKGIYQRIRGYGRQRLGQVGSWRAGFQVDYTRDIPWVGPGLAGFGWVWRAFALLIHLCIGIRHSAVCCRGNPKLTPFTHSREGRTRPPSTKTDKQCQQPGRWSRHPSMLHPQQNVLPDLVHTCTYLPYLLRMYMRPDAHYRGPVQNARADVSVCMHRVCRQVDVQSEQGRDHGIMGHKVWTRGPTNGRTLRGTEPWQRGECIRCYLLSAECETELLEWGAWSTVKCLWG